MYDLPAKFVSALPFMSDESAGRLIKMVASYYSGIPLPESSAELACMFDSIKPELEASVKASEAHREAGRKGGRPPAKKKRAKPESIPSDQPEKKETLSEIVSEYTENQRLRDAILAFAESRKQQRKPLTTNAMRLQLKELDKLSQTDEGKIAVVEQSIARGWLSFYALKQERGPNGVAIKPEAEQLHDLDEIFGIGV